MASLKSMHKFVQCPLSFIYSRCKVSCYVLHIIFNWINTIVDKNVDNYSRLLLILNNLFCYWQYRSRIKGNTFLFRTNYYSARCTQDKPVHRQGRNRKQHIAVRKMCISHEMHRKPKEIFIPIEPWLMYLR